MFHLAAQSSHPQRLILCVLVLAHTAATANTTFTGTVPGCQSQCGNLTVPYPFGIGVGLNCSIKGPMFDINCSVSGNTAKAFRGTSGNVEILDISETQIRMKSSVSHKCYDATGNIISEHTAWTQLGKSKHFTFSQTANKFMVVGCDDAAIFSDSNGTKSIGGCITLCSEEKDVRAGPCNGLGCSQTSFPEGLNSFTVQLLSIDKHVNVNGFDSCGYAFLGEEARFNFSGNVDLRKDPVSFIKEIRDTVPVVLEWTVGFETCNESKSNSKCACQGNTSCVDFKPGKGYRCSCLDGYEGNPYLAPGCTDINECASRDTNNCAGPALCINTPGSYKCSCPDGQFGDGSVVGSGCTPVYTGHTKTPTNVIVGMSFGFLLLLIVISWIWFTLRKRKLTKIKAEFFQQNGGLLLKQKLFSSGHAMDSPRIFTAEELKVATKNYSVDRILGKGGYGTVYQGILLDASLVAIKKPRLCDASQVEQFINEVIILAQVNHRNVVKLLGCCLETEMPLLVYEFISNGSLLEHIHSDKGAAWLSWSNCLRVASEAANALVYLHSAASIPIIHRDVKSANILIDESYTAKIADFGASRLVPMDKTLQVTTLVQGTLGYLDPEYLCTSQLTDKSDVYSFGVVLAELLTREKPLSDDRRLEDGNLSAYFVTAMKEARLFRILYPRIVREANRDQLLTVATLVTACLSLKGEDRPTMKEVALELEQLRKQISFPWIAHHGEETTSSTGDERDLYPVPSTTSLRSDTISSGHCTMQSEIIAPR